MAEEKKEAKVPAKFQSLVSEVEKMSVLDLSELVKVLEEKFGVSAAAPVMAAAAVAPGAAAPAEEAKTSFSVELTSAGANKISVIKVIRELTQLGLKEAKDIADGAPKMLKENVDKAAADEMKKKIEGAGGQVALK